MPKKAVLDLSGDDEQTWMNQVRAARVKGAPLTETERQRILDGGRWDGARDVAPRPEEQD